MPASDPNYRPAESLAITACLAQRVAGYVVSPRPLAIGYLRLHAGDPPELAVEMTGQLRDYADSEALLLADVYTDLLDAPHQADRAGFCALLDTLRRGEIQAVIIPSREHLSRRPDAYAARHTIIEAEGGARLLVLHPC